MKTLPVASPSAKTFSRNLWIRGAVVVAVCGLGAAVLGQLHGFQAESVIPFSATLEDLPPPANLRLPVSLPNGTELQPAAGRLGYSQLTIDNGNSFDAVAKLVDHESSQTVRFVYVKAHQRVTLEGLGVGLYGLKFALGVDWDQQQQRFRQNQSLSAFSQPLEFTIEFQGNQEFWRTYEVTLHPVINGTAQTEPIDESEF